jgi:hypothetical protein
MAKDGLRSNHGPSWAGWMLALTWALPATD